MSNWTGALPQPSPTPRRVPDEVAAALADPYARFATLNEYAQATGFTVPDLLTVLRPLLEDETLALDPFGEEIFIHTAPRGRASGLNDSIAPNLWEVLRSRLPAARAYAVWRLIREMEACGWAIEARPRHAVAGLGPVANPPIFSVYVHRNPAPVVLYPDRSAIISTDGPLGVFERAGAATCAVVCSPGALDETVTAVREWMLNRPGRAAMVVLVLEEPRYEPVMVHPADGSVSPLSVDYLADPRSNYM